MGEEEKRNRKAEREGGQLKRREVEMELVTGKQEELELMEKRGRMVTGNDRDRGNEESVGMIGMKATASIINGGTLKEGMGVSG